MAADSAPERDVHDDELEYEDGDEFETSTPVAVRVRGLIGVAALIAIGHRIYAAEDDMNLAEEVDASAIQIVQLWTPHLFYMMTIIGIAISLYIITRSVAD